MDGQPVSARNPKTAAPKDALSFEEALQRLDETVRKLEAGKLTLAEATSLYEEGVRLARICGELITGAELKISQIRTAFGEQMRFLAEEGADQKGEP